MLHDPSKGRNPQVYNHCFRKQAVLESKPRKTRQVSQELKTLERSLRHLTNRMNNWWLNCFVQSMTTTNIIVTSNDCYYNAIHNAAGNDR